MASRQLDRVLKQLVEHHAIGQIGEVIVCRQILDTLVCLLLFFDTIEILQGKGDVVPDTRQERDDLVLRYTGLAEDKQDYAETLSALDQRYGAGRDRSCLKAWFLPALTLLRVEKVIVYVGRLGSECFAANALAINVSWVG
jgi:hypothetical protein